jgi:hypothetical protein
MINPSQQGSRLHNGRRLKLGETVTSQACYLTMRRNWSIQNDWGTLSTYELAPKVGKMPSLSIESGKRLFNDLNQLLNAFTSEDSQVESLPRPSASKRSA